YLEEPAAGREDGVGTGDPGRREDGPVAHRDGRLLRHGDGGQVRHRALERQRRTRLTGRRGRPEIERADCRPDEADEVRAASEVVADVRNEATDVGPARAGDLEIEIPSVERAHGEPLYVDVARRGLNGRSRARGAVKRTTADLHRREGGGRLTRGAHPRRDRRIEGAARRID